MTLTIPNLCLVVLVGVTGSGKSTFARRHFRATEVLSSDAYRGVVSDDENDQTATADAFAVLHFIAARRLARGRLTVIDATNVQPAARRPLLALAREHNCPAVAIVLDLPEEVCRERSRLRRDRHVASPVMRDQAQQLRQSLPRLEREGFSRVYVLRSVAEVEGVRVVREPLPVDRRGDHGSFDIIGDVHGCFYELVLLLRRLGAAVELSGARGTVRVTPAAGRTVVFLGDLVDRGPHIPAVLRLVMGMVQAGTALCLPGNHDDKLLRALRGRNVQRTHGLAETLAALEAEPATFQAAVADFLDGLVSHYVLDGGRLVVAHAGMKEAYQGRMSRRVLDFALYGETTGETDEYGLPVRLNWAAGYRGQALVVYGHTPLLAPQWLNNTVNIDTGCVFGGRLTALRYPELVTVSVPAARTYYLPTRLLAAAAPRSGHGA